MIVFVFDREGKYVSKLNKEEKEPAAQVQRDLRDNHRRSVSRNYIQSISRATAEVAVEKRQWRYTSGVSASEVSSIGGTCMIRQDVHSTLFSYVANIEQDNK
ncbi:MAG: hypothetical protein LBM08_15660 [Dysgonamonadaceae bacterium]|jgi:hypothetical protein|nr:hypothetical protein [Dysgonamonadaceae bacterium]